MVHRLVIASLFIGATAYAQAPGDQDMDGGAAPGQVAPVVAPVATNPCGGCPYAQAAATNRDVMAHRWAVGLSIGGTSLAPEGSPDNKTDFSFGQLALRFRATYHLELEAAFGGGREQLMDGTEGDRELQVASLALRYRFAAARDWNWWLMGGLGVVTIASSTADDQTRKDAQRPLGELGIGLERRFEHFALQAELRATGVGETRAEKQAVGGVLDANGGQVPTGYPQPMSDKLSGGAFTIGASYYF